MNKARQDIRRKKRVLEHAARIGNVRKACRYFGVARSGFYVWKNAYETQGDEGLINQKPCPYNPRLRTPPEIVEKVLHLRRTYHLGPTRIVWYLERYHGITICGATALPHPATQRPEPRTQPGRSTRGPDAPLREASAGAPRPGGCHVSQADRPDRQGHASLSVHGYRRCHEDSGAQSLCPAYPEECDPVPRSRDRRLSVSDSHRPDGPRA